MQVEETRIDRRDWPLLGLLSVLWGGTFFFVAVALKDLSPLTIVFARVALAALILAPIVPFCSDEFPPHLRDWMPFFVMGILNNVIPFSLLAFAQAEISSGLASILNATTPIFAISVAIGFGEEAASVHRGAGVGLGLLGVVILQAGNVASSSEMGLGTVLCLGAAISYGFAGLWGRRKLIRVSPLTSAACQLISASIVMLLLFGATGSFATISMPSVATWISLIGLASLSTALAYVVFFRILARSGSTNVMLVTLLIPVTSILLGHFVLHEPVSTQEVIGAFLIGSALLVLDGRGLSIVRLQRPS
jgi:drug/metabolite transporter (DMT)-like permease